jgi:hypothetical protein
MDLCRTDWTPSSGTGFAFGMLISANRPDFVSGPLVGRVGGAMKREDCFRIANLFEELDELQRCLRDVRSGVDYNVSYKSAALKNAERSIPARVVKKLIEELEAILCSEVARVKAELHNLGAETEEEALAPASANPAAA